MGDNGTGPGSASGSGASAASDELSYHDILSAEVLVIVLLAFVLGIAGGLARVSRHATDPTSPKLTAWQIVGHAVVGGVAGIAAFYVLVPGSSLRFVSASLIAGYAGPALMDALEARFKILMAEARADHAIATASRALDIADSSTRMSTTAAPEAPPSANAGAKAEIERMRAEIEALRVRR